jgi:hypothetical protein
MRPEMTQATSTARLYLQAPVIERPVSSRLHRKIGRAAMTDRLDSATLRRWAMQCAAQASDPRTSGDDRDRLLKMRTALLDLAKTQDWLDGRPQAGTAA